MQSEQLLQHSKGSKAREKETGRERGSEQGNKNDRRKRIKGPARTGHDVQTRSTGFRQNQPPSQGYSCPGFLGEKEKKRKRKRKRKRKHDRRSLSECRKKEENHAPGTLCCSLYYCMGDTYHRIYKTWLLSHDELLFPSHHWHRLCPRRILAGVIGWEVVPLRRGRRHGFVHFHSCVLFVFPPEILLSSGGAL